MSTDRDEIVARLEALDRTHIPKMEKQARAGILVYGGFFWGFVAAFWFVLSYSWKPGSSFAPLVFLGVTGFFAWSALRVGSKDLAGNLKWECRDYFSKYFPLWQELSDYDEREKQETERRRRELYYPEQMSNGEVSR